MSPSPKQVQVVGAVRFSEEKIYLSKQVFDSDVGSHCIPSDHTRGWTHGTEMKVGWQVAACVRKSQPHVLKGCKALYSFLDLRRFEGMFDASSFISHSIENTCSGVYFETQDGAWCGMHALNNLYGGNYVTKDDCRNAVDLLVQRMRLPLKAARIERPKHLDYSTGWLSLDVMNLLGAASLGLHVE
jgi:hypothetical protein